MQLESLLGQTVREPDPGGAIEADGSTTIVEVPVLEKLLGKYYKQVEWPAMQKEK